MFIKALFLLFNFFLYREVFRKRLQFSCIWMNKVIKTTSTQLKGGFPLSRHFVVRTHVSFTRVDKLKTLYGRSRVYIKLEPRLTFTSTRGLSYIASILFTRVGTEKITRVSEPRKKGTGISAGNISVPS